MTPERFQDHVIDTLARLETHIESLVGNGQPGRVGKLEDEVKKINRWRWILMGGVLAASAIIHFVFRY